MSNSTSTPILASFATLKSLNDSKKYINSYQILAEFIKYIIDGQKLYSFSARRSHFYRTAQRQRQQECLL